MVKLGQGEWGRGDKKAKHIKWQRKQEKAKRKMIIINQFKVLSDGGLQVLLHKNDKYFSAKIK